MDDDINEEHKTYGFFEDDLEKISELVDNQPEEIKEEKEHFGFFDDVPSITPNSVMKLNDIDEKVQNEAVSETKTEVVKTATRKVKPSEQDEETKKSIANNNNNSIRVNLDKIDLLMNNVGDLVITNAMLTQFSSSIEETKTRASVLERLELLERHIRDMLS